jgi:hypothetical protein
MMLYRLILQESHKDGANKWSNYVDTEPQLFEADTDEIAVSIAKDRAKGGQVLRRSIKELVKIIPID